MYTVTFTGFDTPEQARAFTDWWRKQGEQDAAPWMDLVAGISRCVTRTVDELGGTQHLLVTLDIVTDKILNTPHGNVVMLNIKEAERPKL